MAIDLSTVLSNLEAATVGASKPQQNDFEPRPSRSDHDKRMLALWVKLAEGYGHKFTSSAGDEPNLTWVDGLADLSHEKFLCGIHALMRSVEEWPPSLGTFRRW